MANKTNIAKMALGHLKVNINFTDVDTGTGAELNVLRNYIDAAVEFMLEDKKPPWAENYVNLVLVQENPNDLWGYSFRYPNDCAISLDLIDTARGGTTDMGETQYRLGADASGRLIYTDYGPTNTLRYIRRQNDDGVLGWRYEDMPGSWAIALSYLLASLCAGSLSNTASSDMLMRKYDYYVNKALAATLNEQGYDEFPEAASVRARI